MVVALSWAQVNGIPTRIMQRGIKSVSFGIPAGTKPVKFYKANDSEVGFLHRDGSTQKEGEDWIAQTPTNLMANTNGWTPATPLGPGVTKLSATSYCLSVIDATWLTALQNVA